MKYQKISEDDVYKVLVSTSLDFMCPLEGAINLVNIASLLKTSRYQVKNHMDNLKTKGIVELKQFKIPSEDEIYPPYWGYILTEKGKSTEYYKQSEEESIRLIEECFNPNSIDYDEILRGLP